MAGTEFNGLTLSAGGQFSFNFFGYGGGAEVGSYVRPLAAKHAAARLRHRCNQ